MARFKPKVEVEVDAVQWFHNGDHPDDACESYSVLGGRKRRLGEGRVVRYFRSPNIDRAALCEMCGLPMHEHGALETAAGDRTVCPGDWIITSASGERTVAKPEALKAAYDEVGSPAAPEA